MGWKLLLLTCQSPSTNLLLRKCVPFRVRAVSGYLRILGSREPARGFWSGAGGSLDDRLPGH